MQTLQFDAEAKSLSKMRERAETLCNDIIFCLFYFSMVSFDSIWAKQNSRKWNAGVLRCRLINLWMLHWVTSISPQIPTTAPRFHHFSETWHLCSQRSNHFCCCTLNFSLLRILTCKWDTLQGHKSMEMHLSCKILLHYLKYCFIW